MDPQFWLDRWQQKEIGFHREEANPALRKFWPRLNMPPQTAVLVPLCGMSNDMVWLAGQGHKVVGVELSDIAVKAFFETQNLTPELRKEDGFEVFTSGPFELWTGDLFKMPPAVLQRCTGVYDRASLVALPEKLQNDYASLLTAHLQTGAQILLISLAFDQQQMDGPPFSTPHARIQALFEFGFEIDQVAVDATLDDNDNLKERGLTQLDETCTLLRRKTSAQ